VTVIKDYKIPIPSIEEQNKIINIAETLKEQKENMENVYLKNNNGIDEQKILILQKAFAGELKTGKVFTI
jgi:restriction endonuclease S subunit